MKKSSLFIIGSMSVFAAGYLGVAKEILWFLLFGAVPGTTYSLPPTAMAVLLASLFVAAIIYVRFAIAAQKKQDLRTLETEIRKQRAPRRRYARTRVAA